MEGVPSLIPTTDERLTIISLLCINPSPPPFLRFAGRMTSRRQLPGVAFLYVAGVIGWAGRAYLIRSRSSKNPTQMEYIIDVPVALECFGEAAGWPFKAVQELRTGELTEDEDKITVSPR